jgi:hypothetical protein
MSKLKIIGGPDRFAFANSLFTEIDSVPIPGYMTPPHSRGGIQPPSYFGENFLTKDENGKERQFMIVITSSKRKGRRGLIQEFTAVLWAACDEFRDLIASDPLTAWIEFKGELDFNTGNGWLEQTK